MNETDTQTLKEAIATWGAEKQLIIVLEELAELSKEVAKTLRRDALSENLADETADAHIMLAQIPIIAEKLGNGTFEHDVAERITFKMDRLRTRLAEYKQRHQ